MTSKDDLHKEIQYLRIKAAQIKERGETLVLALLDSTDDIIDELCELAEIYEDSPLIKCCICLAISDITYSRFNRLADDYEELK